MKTEISFDSILAEIKKEVEEHVEGKTLEEVTVTLCRTISGCSNAFNIVFSELIDLPTEYISKKLNHGLQQSSANLGAIKFIIDDLIKNHLGDESKKILLKNEPK